jgi:hypothetical protein
MFRTSSPGVSSAAVPDTLAALEQLVDTGRLRAARRETARLITGADPHTLAVLTRCAAALQAELSTAAANMRALWLASPDSDRVIIEACVPGEDYRPDLPTPAIDHAAYRRPRYVAPRNLRITRVQPTRSPRPSDDGAALAAAYERDRGGIDDQPERVEPLPGYELDFDRAAVPNLRGLPCLSCWLERSNADHARGRHDDGLCLNCRDDGRPGIAPLPAGHTRAEAIAARCQVISETAGAGAHPMLKREWKRANATDRAAIEAWVKANPAALSPAG